MSAANHIYLTDEEITGICDPLEQSGAQIRYLRSLGIAVSRKPGGKPLVARSEFERVMSPRVAPLTIDYNDGPDVQALLSVTRREDKHGQKAKRQ